MGRIFEISRLYFLNNDELLELFSNAKNLKKIMTFFPRLFTSVVDVEFNARGEITGLVNESGENLPLVKTINPALMKVSTSFYESYACLEAY